MNATQIKELAEEIKAAGFRPLVVNSGGWSTVGVSAENGDNAADYYGEFRGGYPWINPKLEAIAEQRGGYWEWENAGEIIFNS